MTYSCSANGILDLFNCMMDYTGAIGMPVLLFVIEIVLLGLLISRGSELRVALPLSMVTLSGVSLTFWMSGALLINELIIVGTLTFLSVLYGLFSSSDGIGG